jgi:hypothetical protein
MLRKRKGAYILFGFSSPTDRNVVKKEAEQVLKYKVLFFFPVALQSLKDLGRLT